MCTRCRLHSTRTHAVPGAGAIPAALLLVGEAPGRDEDVTGRPFVGRAGLILDAALAAASIPRESVFITNVVKCRPPENRKPKPDEAGACRGYLMEQIAAVRPRTIVTLGATALRSLMGPRLELKEVRGRRLQFGEVTLIPTYHPAGVLYNRALEGVLRADLRQAARLLVSSQRRIAPHASTGRRTSHGRASRRSRRPPA